MWETLPKLPLLEILKYLSYSDLVAAGQVCRWWYQLSMEELDVPLWRDIFTSYFNLLPSVTLRPGAHSWRQEFIRLTDETPSVLTDLPGHGDQMTHRAVHVSFANTKNIFSVCYGWLGFKVWRASRPSVCIFEDDGREPLMPMIQAEMSKFNATDELLLVSGFFPRGAEAHIWIYRADQEQETVFSLVTRVPTHWRIFPSNPWVDESTFLTYHTMYYDYEEDDVPLDTGICVDTNSLATDGSINKADLNAVNCGKLKTWNGYAASVVGSFPDPQTGLPNLLVPIGKAGQDHNTGISLLKKEWQADHPPFEVPEMKTIAFKEGNLEMGISGLCLAPDQRTCYVNTRPLQTIQDEDGESVVYGEEEFKIFKMDLATMTAVGEPLVGHFAVEGDNDDKLDWILHFSPDVSSDYVACGSETNGACLWDRHYGCLLKVFSPLQDQHHQLPQDRDE